MLSLETQEVSKNYFFEIFNNKKEKKNSKIYISKALMEAEQKKDPKYKTELCKTFSETKQCPYGSKCRFAHGKDELFSKNKGNNYKKKECKSFSADVNEYLDISEQKFIVLDICDFYEEK